jgi:hypothetical protein
VYLASVLASSVVDRVFESRSGKTKDYTMFSPWYSRTNKQINNNQSFTLQILAFSWINPPIMIRTSANYFFCEVFCRSFLSRCSCYFWPLYCVSIFNLRLLITPLLSSTFSVNDWLLFICLFVLLYHGENKICYYKPHRWCTWLACSPRVW